MSSSQGKAALAHYRDHFLSLVKFCKDFASEAATTLSITAPAFVNLDAHANFSLIPSTDFIGPVGFGWHEAGGCITISTGIAVSTFDDPDNLRHIDIMDLLVKRLRPTMKIPVYTLVDGTPTEITWMVVETGVSVDPTGKDTTRSLQTITVQMLSGASGFA